MNKKREKVILLLIVFSIILASCSKEELVSKQNQSEKLNEQNVETINESQQNEEIKDIEIKLGYEDNGVLKILPFTKESPKMSIYDFIDFKTDIHKVIATNSEVEKLIKEYDSIIQSMDDNMECTKLYIYNTPLMNLVELKSNFSEGEKDKFISYQIVFNRGGENDNTQELAKILLDYKVIYTMGGSELDDTLIKKEILMDFINDINKRYNFSIEEKYVDEVIKAYRNQSTEPFVMLFKNDNSIELSLNSEKNIYTASMRTHVVYNSGIRMNK